MADSLAVWVKELKTRYGTMRVIADKIAMSESGFTRGVKRGTLSVENLLDLARETDTHPSTVLRMAGKARVADLIEQLYGSGQDALTTSQREILGLWAAINDPKLRQAVRYTMGKLATSVDDAPPRAARAKARPTPEETEELIRRLHAGRKRAAEASRAAKGE